MNERISVKTIMTYSHVSFARATFKFVDRVMVPLAGRPSLSTRRRGFVRRDLRAAKSQLQKGLAFRNFLQAAPNAASARLVPRACQPRRNPDALSASGVVGSSLKNRFAVTASLWAPRRSCNVAILRR